MGDANHQVRLFPDRNGSCHWPRPAGICSFELECHRPPKAARRYCFHYPVPKSHLCMPICVNGFSEGLEAEMKQFTGQCSLAYHTCAELQEGSPRLLKGEGAKNLQLVIARRIGSMCAKNPTLCMVCFQEVSH